MANLFLFLMQMPDQKKIEQIYFYFQCKHLIKLLRLRLKSAIYFLSLLLEPILTIITNIDL